MGSEISMFSQKSFIEASKKFVCVRLGTFESKANQDLVRDLLAGSLQNTAFVVFAPDGKTKLTKSGRSPRHAFGRETLEGMRKIALQYEESNASDQKVLADYDSFKQALNASAASQRLLVFADPTETTSSITHSNLRTVFNDKEISGRFFFDTSNSGDDKWSKKLTGVTIKNGIYIIRSGQFGQTGSIMAELPATASPDIIKSALTHANTKFAQLEKRKIYREHVSKGREEGIHFRNTMPPGEDRDGDGKIDPKQNGKNKLPAFGE